MRYAAWSRQAGCGRFFALENRRLFDLSGDLGRSFRAACSLECGVHAYRPGPTTDLPFMATTTCAGAGHVHSHDEPNLGAGRDALRLPLRILADPDTYRRRGPSRAGPPLAVAAAPASLVGGPISGILGVRYDLGAVARMQRMKTGALIAFASNFRWRWARPMDAEAPLAEWPRPSGSGLATRSSTTFSGRRGNVESLGTAAGVKDAASARPTTVTLLVVEAPKERSPCC